MVCKEIRAEAIVRPTTHSISHGAHPQDDKKDDKKAADDKKATEAKKAADKKPEDKKAVDKPEAKKDAKKEVGVGRGFASRLLLLYSGIKGGRPLPVSCIASRFYPELLHLPCSWVGCLLTAKLPQPNR